MWDKHFIEKLIAHARSMAVSGWVLVEPAAARRRGRGGPIASGLRVISLRELLEEGSESPALYYALFDLAGESAEWLISSHLGYEAA